MIKEPEDPTEYLINSDELLQASSKNMATYGVNHEGWAYILSALAYSVHAIALMMHEDWIRKQDEEEAETEPPLTATKEAHHGGTTNDK